MDTQTAQSTKLPRVPRPNKDDPTRMGTPHSEASYGGRSGAVGDDDAHSQGVISSTPMHSNVPVGEVPGGGGADAGGGAADPYRNPFRMPSDEEVFALRDEERKRKKQNRSNVQRLKVHEKTTWSSRLATTKLYKDDPADAAAAESKAAAAAAAAPVLPVTGPERRREKENLTDFVQKKREFFLVQMSLDTKREEMRKLEERAQQREEALRKSEQMLEEDAMRFDAFLKENDMKAVEAIKRAEAETKAKLDRVSEIKKLNAQILTIRSEMSKLEEQLDECGRFRSFLARLTPPEWFDEQRSQRDARKKAAHEEAQKAAQVQAEERNKAIAEARAQGRAVDGFDVVDDADDADDAEDADANANSGADGAAGAAEEDDDDLPMYFNNPQQLLDIFAALEESNLFLIQNSQETEEALEELKQKFKDTKVRMDRETESLKSQIRQLKDDIAKEEAKAEALIERSQRNLGGEDNEALLETTHALVSDVYVQCGFDNDANISTLQMLTNVESKLEELFALIEQMPPEFVEAAEKQKEKDRRQWARREKLEVQKKLQEDRIARAILRSKAPVVKKSGKPVMFRSAPPQKKKKQTKSGDKKKDDEEDIREFFQ